MRFAFFKHDACNFDMAVGRFVEGGCYHFRVDAAAHVGNLLGSLVDEQDHDVDFRMIFGDGVGNVLEQDGLTGFGGRHNQGALSLADGGEHIYHAGGYVVAAAAAREIEFFVGGTAA